MADISTVYGSNYYEEAKSSKLNHVAKIIAANMSNYQFEQKLDLSMMFDDGIKQEAIEALTKSIMHHNPKMLVTYINKNKEEINMLPYFIDTPVVDYFRVIDSVRNKIIFFFVTPTGTGVY